jgi:hypothetical protein
MKDILFILAIIILVVIAAKVFLWALKSIVILAIVAAVVYALFRFGVIKKKRL